MCSLRGLWIFSSSGEPHFSRSDLKLKNYFINWCEFDSDFLFRRWKAIENRVKLLEGEKYAEIPSDPEFSQLFLSEVLKKDQNVRKTSIISLKTNQILWPIVYLNRVWRLFSLSIFLWLKFIKRCVMISVWGVCSSYSNDWEWIANSRFCRQSKQR
jgi:hypothetical protein